MTWMVEGFQSLERYISSLQINEYFGKEAGHQDFYAAVVLDIQGISLSYFREVQLSMCKGNWKQSPSLVAGVVGGGGQFKQGRESELISGGNSWIWNWNQEGVPLVHQSNHLVLFISKSSFLSNQKPFQSKIKTKNPHFPLITFFSNSHSFHSQAFYFHFLSPLKSSTHYDMDPPTSTHSNCPCQQLPMIPLIFDKSNGLSSDPFCLPSAESDPVFLFLFF